MAALNTCLKEHLRNWREDFEPRWQEFFAGIEPDLEGLPSWEANDPFPYRLHPKLPRADATHHMLRAFDGLTPEQVRVVIIGQDPYPRRARATGRAFEDGEWTQNGPAAGARSLQRLLQSAAAVDYQELQISETRGDWGRVRNAIRQKDLPHPATPGFFNALADRGVLSVNAAWTFTSTTKGHLKVHIAVWKRVMQHLILKLSSRDGAPPIVFLLLGKKARDLFQSATAEYLNKNPDHPIKTVYCAHPVARSAPGYFQGQNPLRQVNEALGELGAEPIRWWPARVEQPDP